MGVVKKLLQGRVSSKTEIGTILEVIGEKEASCAVKISLRTPTEVHEAIEEVRRSYSVHAVEFVVDMIEAGQDPSTITNILAYLRWDWSQRAVAWGKGSSK